MGLVKCFKSAIAFQNTSTCKSRLKSHHAALRVEHLSSNVHLEHVCRVQYISVLASCRLKVVGEDRYRTPLAFQECSQSDYTHRLADKINQGALLV